MLKDEKEYGVCLVDIGGGTTDIAIYVEGTVWHTAVIPIGGDHVTNDITYLLNAPFALAEDVKIKHGHARQRSLHTGSEPIDYSGCLETVGHSEQAAEPD